jgi:hypothetical protein
MQAQEQWDAVSETQIHFLLPLRLSRPSVFLPITPISHFSPPASLAPYAAIHLLVLTSSDNKFDRSVFTIATATGGTIRRDRTSSLNTK